ncbi:glycosyltransferase family 4 protein [Xylariomycetidae sp. FL0641]|nr:glycosyltransferase family 4 protein [Xylariomycetidae sp. FL0641]
MADDDEKTTKVNKKTIVFLHPDLGIGGAERLVVDAAVGLQNLGHKVVIYTSHCDPAHCFDEARDGTLDVRVRGNTLVPPSLLSRFSILCAILRQVHLILQIGVFTAELAALGPVDAFFVDQLSAGLPLLRLLSSPRTTRLFFYCHFPDLLLAQGRARWWKRAYRLPFDALEQWSTAAADAVAVNSDFTRGVVAATWPALARKMRIETVYPCVDTGAPATALPSPPAEDEGARTIWAGKRLLLSINRFERKKELGLALRALAALPPQQRQGVRLALAGGYDPRVAENVAHHAELEALAGGLGLRPMTVRTPSTALAVPAEADVVFLLNVNAVLKALLLRKARLLVYTPAAEHFGIVPLEAMLAGVPVLAASRGGPRETVVDGVTGWLRPPGDVPAWSRVMDTALNQLGEPELAEMSRAGVQRVKSLFGQEQMARTLDGILDSMMRTPVKWGARAKVVADVMSFVGMLMVLVAVLSAAVKKIW